MSDYTLEVALAIEGFPLGAYGHPPKLCHSGKRDMLLGLSLTISPGVNPILFAHHLE